MRVDYTAIDVVADTATMLNQDIVDRVMAVIGRMPEQTRKVVDYVLMRDMKYQDAADELQVSLNTVKTLLRNGMRILREELKGDEELMLLLIISKNLGN